MAVVAVSETFREAFRVTFLIFAAVYFGIAFAVLRHYFRHAPTSRLRRYHVMGVSAGTSLLVAGMAGEVYDKLRNDEPLVWYGAPTGFLGVAFVTIALFLLFREQRRHNRRKGQVGPNLARRRVDHDPPAPTA